MLSTKLLPYQSEYIQKIVNTFNGDVGHSKNGIVLCTPWGTGKTLMCIESSLRISRILSRIVHSEQSPVLVITQKTIIDNWISNGNSHYRPPLRSTFIGGSNSGSHNAIIQNWCLVKNNHLVITNYEILVNAYKFVTEKRRALLEKKLQVPILTHRCREVLEDFLRQHNKKPDMSLVIPDEQLAKEEMVYSMTEVTCAFYYHRWSTIIIDEGHELRNEKSNAFTAISQLSAHFKIIATADPFNNSIQDIVSLFMICGIPPGVDTRPSSKDNRRTCVHDYCALLPKDAPCAIEIHGAVPGTTLQKRAEFSDNVTTVIKQWNVLTKHQSMVDELCKALTLCRDSYMIQQDKNVLRDHYKPTTIVINPDFVSSEERGLYDFIRSKDSVLVKKTTGTKLSAFSRSRHACSGLYHTEDLNAYFETNDSTHRDCFSSYDEKHSVYFLPTMILAIDSYIHIPLKRGEKTIIFADFQQSVVEIVNHLKRTNPHISIFSADAKVQTSQRDEILRNFETSRGPAILVTTRVFSQGVNIECANHVILADVWWNFVTTDQSESRVSRPSQKKSVFIVKIIIRNSVEELMWAVSERKRKISSQVLKGPITPSLVRKITTLNTVDTFKSNMLLIEDLVPSSSCPSSSSSSSSSLFSMDNPALFQILRQMLEKSADVYVKTTVELRSDPSLIPPTVLLTPFISMIPRTPSSSSSSSSSLSTKQFPRTGFTPVQKLSSANTMIKGNYHYRRFTPLRTSDNPYQKLISRPQQSSQKRQIIEIDDSGNIIGKKSRLN